MSGEIVPEKKNELVPGSQQANGSALASLISGVLAWLWLPITWILDVSGWLAIVLAPISALVAVITGGIAKRNIRQSDGALGGKKMANAGLWLGWIYIIGSLLLTVIVVIIVLAVGNQIISSISGWLQ